MAAKEIKLFGKWGYDGVTVGDLSVEDFIALKPKDHVRNEEFRTSTIFMPHDLLQPALVGVCATHGRPIPD